MKNLNLLEERIKNKQKTVLIFDYYGTLTPINYNHPHLTTISPILKRSLENLSKLNFLDLNIITEMKMPKFASEKIKIHEIKNPNEKETYEIETKKLDKKNLVSEIIENNPEAIGFYFGDDVDDTLAFEEIKNKNGFAIGIKPLDQTLQTVVNLQVLYVKFEEFLSDLNNLYT